MDLALSSSLIPLREIREELDAFLFDDGGMLALDLEKPNSARFMERRLKMTQNLADHEKLELHEYLAFKNVCGAKAMAMSKLASDEHLRELLADDLRITQRQIQEVGALLGAKLQ